MSPTAGYYKGPIDGRTGDDPKICTFHRRLTRKARVSTTQLDELLDALDGPLPEWAIAGQRPRDLRVAILR
jgi:hypothetical protein